MVGLPSRRVLLSPCDSRALERSTPASAPSLAARAGIETEIGNVLKSMLSQSIARSSSRVAGLDVNVNDLKQRLDDDDHLLDPPAVKPRSDVQCRARKEAKLDVL